jgi:ABC-type multidrug transport system fused ATPase/permease subunit
MAITASLTNSDQNRKTPKTLPDIWALIKPRRGLLALGFVLMAVNRVSSLVLPASTKYFVDNVVWKRELHLLTPIVLAILAATILQGLTSFALTQLLSKSAQKMISDLRRRLQKHIGRLPVSFYDTNKTGVLVSRIMSDVEGVRNFIGTGMVDFVGGLMTAVIAVVYLLHLSLSMTFVAFAILVVFGSGMNKAFRHMRAIFSDYPRINAELTGRLTESLAGVRVIKGYHAEGREHAIFSAGVQRLLDNILRTLTATSLLGLSGSTLLGLVSALILELGGHRILNGGMSLGAFLSFNIFLGLLIVPVFQIVAVGTQITEAIVGLERTREILNEKPEGADPSRTVTLQHVRGQVVMERVNFAYEAGNEVLHEISFEAGPGTITALVGPSGAGKSTIAGLMAAFYTPSSGRVLVDNTDLATVRLDSYRTQLGVVLQETFLFDGTIRENVAFACPEASEGEILAACRIARVDEFAKCLEKQYDTLVGERGVKLSGGQKQRVSIARAILADPRILILDEATSSLDSESEALIEEGLRYLLQRRTTFVIAHRLSTIRRADQILVMEAGRIIERGTHHTLYALGGRYYDLYTKQHAINANLFLVPGEDRSPQLEGNGSHFNISNAQNAESILPDTIPLACKQRASVRSVETER